MAASNRFELNPHFARSPTRGPSPNSMVSRYSGTQAEPWIICYAIVCTTTIIRSEHSGRGYRVFSSSVPSWAQQKNIPAYRFVVLIRDIGCKQSTLSLEDQRNIHQKARVISNPIHDILFVGMHFLKDRILTNVSIARHVNGEEICRNIFLDGGDIKGGLASAQLKAEVNWKKS
ncbi:hypothetical protein CEXT_696111 [Caerostris extrusa]|uniref:Uncharacterized protein n=1 Tax=Caerostris extrusa TaxID=172846 RepID=A0AAV4XIS9_CAEEX|nr:hypothetical protein CEXT_696111 [Caerostris extrusa]